MMTKKIRSSETISQKVRIVCQCPDIQPSCFIPLFLRIQVISGGGDLRPIKMNPIKTILCYVYPNHLKKISEIKQNRAQARDRDFVHWAYQS
jgi:hypothetical protein